MSHYKENEHPHNNRNPQQGPTQIDKNPTVQAALYFALLLAITIVPLFVHIQSFSGVWVNFILIFTCLKLGIRYALPLTFVPSIAAVSSGLFPLVLAPMIPFIIVGNILLILIIHLFKCNFFVSLSIAALAKFALLYSTSHFLAQYFLPEMFFDKVVVMMGWHQFATAMMGGLFAFFILKGLSFTQK